MIKVDFLGKKPVVKADGSWTRGPGFKPRHRKLDGCKQFASYYIKRKIENKGSQMLKLAFE